MLDRLVRIFRLVRRLWKSLRPSVQDLVRNVARFMKSSRSPQVAAPFGLTVGSYLFPVQPCLLCNSNRDPEV